MHPRRNVVNSIVEMVKVHGAVSAVKAHVEEGQAATNVARLRRENPFNSDVLTLATGLPEHNVHAVDLLKPLSK